MAIMTIDFEASCLPRHGRSYPIEVGVAGRDASRSWLIRPHRDWQGWDWTAQAQALHGISRDQIEHEGMDAGDVVAALITVAGSHRLVADSLIDQYWLDSLMAAAGQSRRLSVDHVSMMLDELDAGEACLSQALERANAQVAERHRAAADARWLAAVIADLGGDMAVLDQPAQTFAGQR